MVIVLCLIIAGMAIVTMFAERRRKSEFSEAMRAIREIDKYIKSQKEEK